MKLNKSLMQIEIYFEYFYYYLNRQRPCVVAGAKKNRKGYANILTYYGRN